jgi:hypothetical protein
MIEDIRHASLVPGGHITLPDCPAPYYTLLVAHVAVEPQWQFEVSKQLVASGCSFVSAWGIDCSSWDDSVDWADIERRSYGMTNDMPFVMTTWHGEEPLRDVIGFVLDYDKYEEVKPLSLLILEISRKPRTRRISQIIARLAPA